MIGRRAFLAGLGGAAVVAAVGGATYAVVEHRPVALVYRGAASCPGCSESVAALLRSGPHPLHPMYCGPDEDTPLDAESLAGAAVYAQPGGGDVAPAWRHLRDRADDIRGFVARGGVYLGFCLGGYLAGATPGFTLLPGDTDQYIRSAGAVTRSTDDTVIPVQWAGVRRHMFFQDGPQFLLRPGADASVVATYTNGDVAAVVAPYGQGRVGVVGPHPEADRSWYADAGLSNPDGVRLDLGRDLVRRSTDPPDLD